MIKLIIFDLWKTLAHRKSAKGITSQIKKTTKPKISIQELIKIYEQSTQTKKWRSKYDAYKNLCHNIKFPVTENNVQKLIKTDDRRQRLGVKTYAYAIPLLKKLRKVGYKTGIISNSSIFAIKHIHQTGVLKYIDYPLFSYQVGAIKPSLKIFKTMLKIAKCKPTEAIMVGDKMGDDVIPPKKIGMNAIHFTGYQNLKTSLKKYNIYL